MRSLFCIALFALLFSTVSAQSVTVSSELTKYKRTGFDVPDHKKDFEINYPRYSGRPAPVLEKLKDGTDYWKLFDMSLEDNLADDDWLSSCDYTVKYNAKNLLSIWLSCDGTAAYVSGMTKYLSFDLRSGEKLKIEDLFKAESLAGLNKAIINVLKAEEAKMDAEGKEYLADERKSYPEIKPTPDNIKLKDLSGFTITDKGVIFHYEYNFPNVIKALEPSGELFISFANLKPFISPDGLLGGFVR